MNLPVMPTVDAKEDIIELIRYFDDINEDLGDKFIGRLYDTYEMIAHMPELGQLYPSGIPQCKMLESDKSKSFQTI
jgi:plasmid stabilization system protein ParE